MGNLILPRSGITPSYASGFARSAAESANPGLWKGLVGAWVPALGVTGSVLHNATTYSSHGTLINMEASDWMVGQAGYALDLDGSGEYIDCGNDNHLRFTDSVTVLLYNSSPTPGSLDNFVGRWDTGADKRSWAILYDSGRITFYLTADGTWAAPRKAYRFSAADTATIIDSSYHLFGFTFASDDLRLFLDGTERVATKTFDDTMTDVHSSDVDLLIGCATNNGAPFRYAPMEFTAIYLWHRALSANEIFDLWVDHLAPFRLAPLHISTAGEAPAGELPPGSLALLGVGV